MDPEKKKQKKKEKKTQYNDFRHNNRNSGRNNTTTLDITTKTARETIQRHWTILHKQSWLDIV